MSGPIAQVVGSSHYVQIRGIKLLGFNGENAHKLLFTVILFAFLYLLSKTLRFILAKLGGDKQRPVFWTRQAVSLTTFILGVVGLVSIWFDNPSRLATGAGLLSAGLAFALQKVVTSFAGYFVILRGKTFNVGDRIKMGSVRGDVIALNFLQTVIMEMGEPPAEQEEDPGMWVHSRQYSGRIVTISNDQIFEEPVYNYSRDFQYIWEEMHIPISYKDDWRKAEQIILHAVRQHTQDIEHMAAAELQRLKERYFVEEANMHPRVYVRLTDNWIELAVRFLCKTHDVRLLKDQISREMLEGLGAAGIGIASGTYEIVGVPPIRVESLPRSQGGQEKQAA